MEIFSRAGLALFLVCRFQEHVSELEYKRARLQTEVIDENHSSIPAEGASDRDASMQHVRQAAESVEEESPAVTDPEMVFVQPRRRIEEKQRCWGKQPKFSCKRRLPSALCKRRLHCAADTLRLIWQLVWG